MKKLLKIFSYVIIIVIVLAITLTVVAKLSEDKITDMVLKKLSESIEAPLVVDGVSFNLIRKFPLATIELENVLLGVHYSSNGSDSVSNKLDTIISISKVYISVKSKPLLKGFFEIKKVEINGALINYMVDTSGTTNIDFLIKSSKTSETDSLPKKPLNLTLTDLSIKNLICNFNDSLHKAKAHVVIPKLKIDADIQSENILASAKGEINLTNCSLDNTNLYLMNKTFINFDVNYETDSINIKQLIVNTDGANLDILGSVCFYRDIKTNITFEGTDFILSELVKYTPEEILKKVGLRKISGKMNLEGEINGTYSDTELPKIDLSLDFQKGDIVTSGYPELKNISFKGKVTNGILRNNKSTQIDLNSFHFETALSKFDVAFSVLDIDHPKYNINADIVVNTDEFNKYIADSLIQNVNGIIKAKLSTKGELPDSIGNDFADYIMANTLANIELDSLTIDVDSSLSVENFSTKIDYTPNNLKISDLTVSIPAYKATLKNTSFDAYFQGSINNKSNITLDLKSFHIETGSSEFTGFATIKNFEKPTYSLTSNIKLNLDEAKTMFPDSLITNLSGKMFADIESFGTLNLDSVADQAMNIVFKTSSFKFIFEDVSIETPYFNQYKIENFSGLVNMNPDAITINKTRGIAGKIEFEIDSTTIKNLYNTVIKNQAEQLSVDTRINFGNLDYTMLTPFMVNDSVLEKANPGNTAKVKEPHHFTILIKGAAKVESLTYNKVFVKDISALFNIKDSVYTLDKFKFTAFDGNINSSVKYAIRAGNMSIIEMHNIIEKIDIKKLLVDFDNFKDFYKPGITHENISGLLSTNLNSKFVLIGDSLIQNDMRVKGDLKIENGGVYDFEPAMELSKFTGIKELDNIQFKTLECNIFMFKNKLYVPKTNIVSTALDITAYGMQSLGEDYEYHFQLHLGDVLKGKSKRLLKEQSQSGDEIKDEDIDRSTVDLVHSKIKGKTKTGFDNKNLQKTMETKIRVQEKMLNLIFRPEWFNFDTKVYSIKQ
ncbi:MAG: hypothetical protein A2X13_08010 [Bacteroidetes bacterium GWC2_33_15]|nr:MAG: hypothetical protein A2X10_05065 [Bacteroidetes bacterium GWA2_33_15]OFX52688.1 MAG: hypothetical protein A2X13_08010 [Bacteroidetes bacterium GWC2_33_15]OFX64006.1 MAG: hypothetical protein A2X15_02325 [Bacteroidetes bacterium GWB2_32_14]OFX67309.1 MAG: hypothetical protein A2X14_12090 [Bacteroidetes bacterium GWD2_33_33]HAN18825.1 hypothetical protein [Bacteroidales bacterium]